MDRKDFLKIGSAGMISTAFGINRNDPTESLSNFEKLRYSQPGWDGKEIVCNSGIVCASQPLAVAVGYDILKAGGNAIDSAVAVNAMLCLVEPMMCGIGGDLFAIVWSANEKKLFGLNASGRSPYNWSYKDAKKSGLKSIPSFGPMSWSVPGCVSGWTELLSRFGKKKLPELLAPAINYALTGFPVSKVIGNGWNPEKGADFTTLKGVYFFNDKKVGPGYHFTNPDLASTFKILSDEGGYSFYKGEIADRIVDFSRKLGGKFQKRDFLDHKAEWVEPISTGYRGYDIWQLPPNGQGMVVLQMMNILERFDVSALRSNPADFFHLFLEAKKICFEDRFAYIADPDFKDIPIKYLISKEYAEERSKLINLDRASQKFRSGTVGNTSETIYLTVGDDEGNMVSLIQSIYSPWGSHCLVDGLGFTLQNRGALFSLDEHAWNRLEPHKRPFHTIIPSFITKNNEPIFSYGVTGGDFQSQGQVQILASIIDFDMPIQRAGEQLRLWHRDNSSLTNEAFSDSGKIIAEPGFSGDIIQKLKNKGHRFSSLTRYFGGYQGIWRTPGAIRYSGASDPRKDGCSFGY